MGSKARRKRARAIRRERERERELEEEYARLAPDHVACADADLALVMEHLEDVFDVLHDVVTTGAQVREHWPPDPAVGELHVVLEELRETALACRDRLGVVHDRLQRLRNREDHFHLVGDRVVRMAVVEAARPEVGAQIDEDIPF
jgi:hypothetical protein